METSIKKPKVSILIPTYNRADIISETFDCIINQTYTDFEFVIVNNGSTDHTAEVLKKYEKDPRVRIFTLPVNQGYAKGYNFGLDQLRGEWFAAATDDDPLMLDALEVMMRIPEEVDPEVNAVTANCLLTSTGKFAGKGLDRDQYLDLETIVRKCSGEFWGITKRELLGDLRFNVDLPGNDDVLWYKIDAVAKRYYIHRAVITFNDHGVSVTNLNKGKNLKRQAAIYRELLKEDFYWSVLEKHYKRKFQEKCFKGWLFLTMANEPENASAYLKKLKENKPGPEFKILSGILAAFKSNHLQRFYHLLPKRTLRFLNRT
jgi:glycosyltransferase involved in cell wall biosynthesis